jgi:predicted secreted acid phosphatase
MIFLACSIKKPVAECAAEVDKIKDVLGRKFIVFPNPLHGDWEGAIYNFVIY